MIAGLSDAGGLLWTKLLLLDSEFEMKDRSTEVVSGIIAEVFERLAIKKDTAMRVLRMFLFSIGFG